MNFDHADIDALREDIGEIYIELFDLNEEAPFPASPEAAEEQEDVEARLSTMATMLELIDDWLEMHSRLVVLEPFAQAASRVMGRAGH